MDPILRPPIGFAHRGARAHAPENTIEAFSLALKLGATGLESDVWVTADGVPVLDHDGVVRSGLRRMKDGAERRAADLAAAGIDAVNLHHSDWNLGLATLFHRFDRYCFGWDAQFERVLSQLLRFGLDAVYSDHVDRMVDAITAATR